MQIIEDNTKNDHEIDPAHRNLQEIWEAAGEETKNCTCKFKNLFLQMMKMNFSGQSSIWSWKTS